MGFLITLAATAAARMIDPIIVLIGIVPYFAIAKPWQASVGMALGAGLGAGLLLQSIAGGQMPAWVTLASVLGTMAAAGAWWSIFYWGRKLIPPRAFGSGPDEE